MGEIIDLHLGVCPSLVRRIELARNTLFSIIPELKYYSDYPKDWKKANYVAVGHSVDIPGGTLQIFYGFLREPMSNNVHGIDRVIYAQFNFKVLYIIARSNEWNRATAYLKDDFSNDDFGEIYTAFIDAEDPPLKWIKSIKTVARDLKKIAGTLKPTKVPSVLIALDIVFDQQKSNLPADLRLK